MNIKFYKIECLTNLHVGSGEVNYNIVDNEVEKDPVTALPVIHASGVKGALREALKGLYRLDQIDEIFGKPGENNESGSGTHKFLDATLIARPMRVWGQGTRSFVSVVTPDSVNVFLKKLDAFGVNPFEMKSLSEIVFGKFNFLTSFAESIRVENEPTGEMSESAKAEVGKLASVIGADVAVVRKFDDYDLPVVARNCLQDKKGNLWYEEVVPHGSVLYFAVIYPDGCNEELKFPPVVQFGGNASIGCGFTKITKIAG